MSIVKATKHQAKSAGRQLSYAMNEDKTISREDGQKYVEGFGGLTDPNHASEEFRLNKQHWNKPKGRQCCHYINSFLGHEVTPAQALDLTRELIEKSPQFKGFQGVLACHCNDEHIHVHVVVDSVNVENGLKFQMGPADYKAFKIRNQEICKEHGLSVTPLQKSQENIRADELNKYKAIERGDSLIDRCYSAVQQSKDTAKSKEEFIKSMNDQGWDVRWDNRKTVCFISTEKFKKDGKPYSFRNSNLEKTYQAEGLGKEELLNAFENNRTRATEHSTDRGTAGTDKRERPADRTAEQRMRQSKFRMRQADVRERETAGVIKERRDSELAKSAERLAKQAEKVRRASYEIER